MKETVLAEQTRGGQTILHSCSGRHFSLWPQQPLRARAPPLPPPAHPSPRRRLPQPLPRQAAREQSCPPAGHSLSCAAAAAAPAAPGHQCPARGPAPHCDTRMGSGRQGRRAAVRSWGCYAALIGAWAGRQHGCAWACRRAAWPASQLRPGRAHVRGSVQAPPYCCIKCSGAIRRSSSS